MQGRSGEARGGGAGRSGWQWGPQGGTPAQRRPPLAARCSGLPVGACGWLRPCPLLQQSARALVLAGVPGGFLQGRAAC